MFKKVLKQCQLHKEEAECEQDEKRPLIRKAKEQDKKRPLIGGCRTFFGVKLAPESDRNRNRHRREQAYMFSKLYEMSLPKTTDKATKRKNLKMIKSHKYKLCTRENTEVVMSESGEALLLIQRS